ncbi:MAG TPA: alpha/beta hydrolase [Candidatus Binatia bacterium]|nr:alpha/beta hydrolase [Candidatus Binatia bacterium]
MNEVGYKGFRADELEYQFNPRVSVPEFPELSKVRAALSRKVRESAKSWLDVPYGKSPREKLDIYAADKPGGPVFVYLHGGYWRGGSKEDNCNFAPTFTARGATVVLVEYDLCPRVTVSEIVGETRSAVAWIYRNIARYRGDPGKIHLAGASAGGHLTAMALAHDWEKQDLPRDIIKGAVVISGVYDLDMVMRISVQEEVRLTPEMARENNPFLRPPIARCPILVAVGGAEPKGWQQMSEDYFNYCKARGRSVEFLVVPGANHYTVPEQFLDASSSLTQATLEQMVL